MADVVDAPLELFALSPLLSKVLDYWSSNARGRVGPAWRDISLMDFPVKLIPTTMVIDVAEPIEKSTYRFWGSRLTLIHGQEMTGRRPYDLNPPDFARQLLKDHAAFIALRRPQSARYRVLGVQGFEHTHDVLRLPLSDNSVDISQIIVCAEYPERSLRTFAKSGVTLSKLIAGTTKLSDDE